MALVRLTTRAARAPRRSQLEGEEEVAEVVDPEMDLEPVFGQSASVYADPGVVDEDVEPPSGFDDLPGCITDRSQAGQVESDVFDAASGCGDLFHDRFDALGVPAGGDHMEPGLSQADGGRPADARPRTGDEGDRHHGKVALRESRMSALSLSRCT
jgi:hypothetical protein